MIAIPIFGISILVSGLVFAIGVLVGIGNPWITEALEPAEIRTAKKTWRKRRDALLVEYIGYGFAEDVAWKMAEKKMSQDAEAAKKAVDAL